MTHKLTFYVRAEKCIPGKFTGVERKLSAAWLLQIRWLVIDDQNYAMQSNVFDHVDKETNGLTKRDGSKGHDHVVLNFAGPLGLSNVRRVMTLVGGAKMIPWNAEISRYASLI